MYVCFRSLLCTNKHTFLHSGIVLRSRATITPRVSRFAHRSFGDSQRFVYPKEQRDRSCGVHFECECVQCIYSNVQCWHVRDCSLNRARQPISQCSKYRWCTDPPLWAKNHRNDNYPNGLERSHGIQQQRKCRNTLRANRSGFLIEIRAQRKADRFVGLMMLIGRWAFLWNFDFWSVVVALHLHVQISS